MAQAESGFTISSYIIRRLEEAGVRHIFGCPGDYILGFIHEVIDSPIQWIGACNELNAGYAADGYARVNGLAAAVVTYGVGGFSILNAVAGAYAEQAPVALISGAPPTVRRRSGAMVHHLTKDYALQMDIFRKVTVDATMLTDPQTAPDEIDRVLSNCILKKRPVYIEIPMEMANVPCRAPAPLTTRAAEPSDPEALAECVEDVARRIDAAEHPVVLVGVEIVRFSLAEAALRLVERVELPFATTVASKSALPELHPQFIGVYQGALSREHVREEVETSDCVLSLGVWMTDLNTGGFSAKIESRKLISANTEGVRIGSHSYSGVAPADFIAALESALTPRDFVSSHPSASMQAKGEFQSDGEARLTVRRFYERLNTFLDDSMVLLVETGDAICAAPGLYIEEPDNFIAQAYYLSTGYCAPAALGVSLARPEKRAVVLAGDGAFQMTAQAVSTLMRYKVPAIIFLLNNGGYVILRKLSEDGPYNDIQNWRYHLLPSVFGDHCVCMTAQTEGELEGALEVAEGEKEKLVFIELRFPAGDCSPMVEALSKKFQAMSDRE